MSSELDTERQELVDALNQAEAALTAAERERDDWEPDSDNSDHTAPYDAMIDEQGENELPEWLNHVKASDLMREHNWSAYIDGWNTWEDGIRSERERRQTWSDFDELCDAVEDAETERDNAQEALERFDEEHGSDDQ